MVTERQAASPELSTEPVHVVTFESEGSGSYNWFYLAADADKNYTKAVATYEDFEGRTKLARFDVAVPRELVVANDSVKINEWLEKNVDVYAQAGKASQRAWVGKVKAAARDDDDIICASFGGRYPAYANWYYVQIRYCLSDDSHQKIAKSSATLFCTPKQWKDDPQECIKLATERQHANAARKLGKPIGFGPKPNLLIKGYEVFVPIFQPHPEEIVVRLKEDAPGLLTKHLSDGRPPSAGFSAEEQQSIRTITSLLGEDFTVTRDEDIPQMSSEQFWNTMPTKQAPAGFYLPKGLCEVMSRKIRASSELIEKARELYQTDDIQIDDKANLSSADDGDWVSAWVWVRHENKEESE